LRARWYPLLAGPLPLPPPKRHWHYRYHYLPVVGASATDPCQWSARRTPAPVDPGRAPVPDSYRARTRGSDIIRATRRTKCHNTVTSQRLTKPAPYPILNTARRTRGAIDERVEQ